MWFFPTHLRKRLARSTVQEAWRFTRFLLTAQSLPRGYRDKRLLRYWEFPSQLIRIQKYEGFNSEDNSDRKKSRVFRLTCSDVIRPFSCTTGKPPGTSASNSRNGFDWSAFTLGYSWCTKSSWTRGICRATSPVLRARSGAIWSGRDKWFYLYCNCSCRRIAVHIKSPAQKSTSKICSIFESAFGEDCGDFPFDPSI